MITLGTPLSRDADSVVGAGPVVLPRVNLLPPEIAVQARFRKVQAGLGLGVLAAVAVVGAVYLAASGSVADAQERLDSATSQQAALTRQAAGYRDVTAVYTRATAAQQMLVTAMGEEVRYSGFLTDLTRTMPPGLWLTGASWSQQPPTEVGADGTPAGLGTVTLSGVAFTQDDVARWLEVVAAQRGYTDAYLSSSTQSLIGDKVVVTWSATATLTPDALSGRYVTPGS